MLDKEDMLISDVGCFAKAKGAVDVFGALTSGKVPLGFCRPQALEEVGPAIMIVGPFFKKTFDLVESPALHFLRRQGHGDDHVDIFQSFGPGKSV